MAAFETGLKAHGNTMTARNEAISQAISEALTPWLASLAGMALANKPWGIPARSTWPQLSRGGPADCRRG